ncbi:hypothetical protein SAMN04487907_103168 [Zunongwangia mangrovi]|uniref:Uncharacterized protein n=1 Tax=Zunongwangia mangrovi TaxID=1334022 RepID=A0A1I1HYY9_9FLAO|nr:hypothetical protein [Zunongwangia mangrovi]SFC27178.1 hypothetical protein SAMN04487907_103168 [Zunongwangia mangrovi]
MENNLSLKYVEQRWEGLECWVGNDEIFWVRLDFFLEYYIAKNVLLSLKYKKEIKNFNIAKEYYQSLYEKFMNITLNGKNFDYSKYIKWQKLNKLEVQQAVKLISSSNNEL